MNLVQIAWRSILDRRLSSTLTSLSVALSIALLVIVLVLYGIIEMTFRQSSIGYDLIIGPKGSPLELVLAAIYRINPPAQNLPYRFYEEVKKDPRVKNAIPITLGDVTQEGAFPIVGTIRDYFLVPYAPNREYRIEGKLLSKPFDAMIGSQVARQNGWKIGSQLQLVHGGAEGHVHDEKFTVVGILAPTGTPNDRSVFVNLPGFYLIQGHDAPFDESIRREREFFGQPPLSSEEMATQVARLQKRYAHDHDHSHGGAEHFHDIAPVQKQVTAILVEAVTPIAAGLMQGEYRTGYRAQAINPIQPMERLLTNLLGNVRWLLLFLVSMIVLVAGLGMAMSVYNSMQSRRREIAIMRALGARRESIFGIVLLESTLLCVGGGLIGFLAGHLAVLIASPIIESQTGIVMPGLSFQPVEIVIFPLLILLSVLVGLLPALSAYRTDVATHLYDS